MTPTTEAAATGIPPFGRTFRIGSMALAAAFALLCLFRVHGFSLAAWHTLIDGSIPDEVLIGKPRDIRLDDWVVGLPLVLSQAAQQPSFPTFNRIVGDGNLDNRVGPPVPMRSWLTLFRPQVWGYFIQNDVGLAWHWWFRVLVLLHAYWAVFILLVGPARTWVALGGAVALLFSPFFQFWALISEPLAAMAGLCFVAATGIAFAATARKVLLFGILLAWAGASFVLGTIYPPFQVPLAYFFVVLTGAYLWRERARFQALGKLRLRLFTALGAGAVVLILFAVYLAQSWEAIGILRRTVYPAGRTVTGGDATALLLLNNFYTCLGGERAFAALGNICEGAAFFYLFPPILAFVLWQWIRRRISPDPIVVALGAYILVLLAYALVGFPQFAARVTLLDAVPGGRAVLGLGLASAVITVLFLAGAPKKREPGDWAAALVLSCAFGAATFWICKPLMSVPNGVGRPIFVVATVGLLVVSWLVLTRVRAAMGIVAALSVALTFWFNPLARGGSEYLRSNPLSQAILDSDRTFGGGSVWVVYNDVWLTNLLRAIGLRAINGVHYYPQFGLWSRLDPQGAASEEYNRYAHVVFGLGRPGTEPQILSPHQDSVLVALHPEHPAFARLGVNFLLYSGDDKGMLRRCANLTKVATVGNRTIYRVR